MKYIVVPGTHIKLVEGNVIILQKDTSIRWVLHFGCYDQLNDTYRGWYGLSIPDNSFTPIVPDDLVDVEIVSTEYNDALPPYPYLMPPQRPMPPRPEPPIPPVPPHPPGPEPPEPPTPPEPQPVPPERIPAFFSKALKTQLLSAFITVDNIEARDALNPDDLSDGKLVRVNDVEGVSRYYEWDTDTSSWVDANLLTTGLLDSINIVAGDGLAGGGPISTDVELRHGDTGTGEPKSYTGVDTLDVVSGLTVDEFGHVTSVEIQNISEGVAEAAEDNPNIAKISDIPVWQVIN